MEFISDGAAAQTLPTDPDLSAYLQSHPDSFRVDQQFTFRQVFLNPDRHGKNLASDAAQLLAQLNQDGGKTDISKRGYPKIMLDNDYHALPVSEAGRIFGDKFAGYLVGPRARIVPASIRNRRPGVPSAGNRHAEPSPAIAPAAM